jgi:hypothetical protein
VPATLRVRPEVAARLRYYVYAYVDPRTDEIFYVGKGCGRRVLAHLDDARECEKTRRIAKLRDAGLEPHLDIIAHGMVDEETALRVEAALIDVLRLSQPLTNRVRGFRSLQFGRAPLQELEILYAARHISISEPAILIRINQLYRPGMRADALYEATRGIWKVGAGGRRDIARYAFAVYQGVVREVFEIQSWHRAGTTPYSTRLPKDVTAPNRWEFLGRVAEKLGRRYRGGSVERHFRRGAQTPFTYVNC